MTKPLYNHDCPKCRFVGIDTPRTHNEIVSGVNGVDMYICNEDYHKARNSEHRISVIRRRSSSPCDYSSWEKIYVERAALEEFLVVLRAGGYNV